ncbi:LuxR C-terminal-related transcriptional regulator [Arthrobacter sp. GCM10027362]|uniref:helix-turn-helix transcriptional regulator n=1 Tax=Arthrobacter sp. GCM10027362 TaxID=3273379 RepID=UPI00363E2DA3
MDEQCTALIGRQDQVSAVVGALTDARSGGAMVLAPAGMGKTALLHALMASAADRFRFIRLAAGTAAGMDVRFGALTPMLARLPVGGEQAVADVLRTVLGFVGTDADLRRRPVIVVDDADELDPGSARVLARLAAGGAARLLVSARPGHGQADGPAAPAGGGRLQRVELEPLTWEQRDEFCRAELGSPVLSGSIRMLGEASGGNPRSLGLLLEEARRTGRLVQRNGVWLLLGEVPAGSPALLDATRLELLRLGQADRAGITMLALMGPVRRSAAEQLVDPETIDRLAAAGYLDPGGSDAQLRLTPALHEESVRRLAPVGLKRLVHRWFGGPQAAPLAEQQRLLAVRWAMDSGEPVPEGQLLVAAEAANAAFLPGTALAIARGGTSSAAAVQLARAHLYRGHLGLARSLAWQVIRTSGDPEQVAQAAGLAAQLVQHQGEGRAALEELAAAWQAALVRMRHPAGSIPDCPGVELLRLQARHAGGRPADMLGDLDRLLRSCADRPDHVQALVLLAEVQSAAGLGVQGTATVMQALEQITGGADSGPVPVPQLRIRLARQLIRNGELEAAARQLALLEESGTAAMLVLGGSVDFLRAWLALKRGFVRDALDLLAAAVEGLRLCDPEQLLPCALGRAAAAAALAEDRPSAGRYAEEFGALAHHGPPETSLLAQAHIARSTALFGGTSAAVERLADIAGSLAGRGLPAAELEVRMLMIRLGDRDRLGEMIRCAGAVEGAEAEIYLGLARALRTRSGKQALATAEKAAAAGHLMVAAEAAAQSVRHFAGEANHRLAKEAGRFLQNLRRQWPGIAGPRLPHATSRRQLTRRERDVAVMAAGGIRTREIAARLGVSVRTVEGHLYRIYEKLDIRSRRELALRFGREAAAGPVRPPSSAQVIRT